MAKPETSSELWVRLGNESPSLYVTRCVLTAVREAREHRTEDLEQIALRCLARIEPHIKDNM